MWTKICLSNEKYDPLMMYLNKDMSEQGKVQPINDVSKQRYVWAMKIWLFNDVSKQRYVSEIKRPIH